MTISITVKRNVEYILHKFGINVSFRANPFFLSIYRDGNRSLDESDIVDCPLEALSLEQDGKNVVFMCPLDKVVSPMGFSYSPETWHPFVETVREFSEGDCESYESSVLKKYYEKWTPDNAAEALVGFEKPPSLFYDQPAHIHRLYPWKASGVEKIDKEIRSWAHKDNMEHGYVRWKLETDGYQFHGPVSHEKGNLEFKRLTKLYKTIKKEGYNLTFGGVSVLMLRNGDEFRFIQAGPGIHRTAVMAGLGYELIPAEFKRCCVIDIDFVDYWPQVLKGIWSRESAVAYFNYLFNYNSRAWANKIGL